MKNKPKIEQIPVDALIPYARNSRTHSEAQVAQIAGSIREFGFTNPVLIDAQNGIIAGHGRIMAAQKLGLTEVPCIRLDHLTETQARAYIIADNKLALNAGWDEELLGLELADLRSEDFDLGVIGFDDDEIDGLLAKIEGDEPQEGAKEQSGNLASRFGAPPLSVLNAREGWWQERKREWLAIGIKSEIGRNSPSNALGSTFKGSTQSLCVSTNTGTSIFDPVLCELAYRWFSPPGGTIIDPFAGGSVRGIVASKLVRRYVGHELRAEQVAANREQATQICGDDALPPVWVEGDSRNIDRTCADVAADMFFTCPPYADLEVYSNDPADLSTLPYADFRAAYFEIINKTCALLKPDSFAVCVVGEVRDKRGNYINFVGDTVHAFCNAGLEYYGEAILVTPIGTVAMQTSRNFPIGRKLGKTHQNVLVFVKGDGKRAAKRCGDCSDDIDLTGVGSDEGEQDDQPQQVRQDRGESGDRNQDLTKHLLRA